MRKPRIRQSPLDNPLTAILATEASVRVLRLLVEHPTAWPIAELAERAGLTVPGTHLAVATAIHGGIAEDVGSPRSSRIRLRVQHPLVPELTSLFAAESGWVKRLQLHLRAMFQELRPEPTAVWVETPQDTEWPLTLVVRVLASPEDVDRIRARLEDAIADTEGILDVIIDLRPMTRTDLNLMAPAEKEALDNARIILGPAPTAFLETWRAKHKGSRPHTEHDKKLLTQGHELSEVIKRDPTALDRALDFVEHRLERASQQEAREAASGAVS